MEPGAGVDRSPDPVSPPVRRRAFLGSLGLTVAGVAAAVGTFFLLGELHVYSIPFVLKHLPEGVPFAITSLELTTISFLVGFVLALPLAVIRAFSPPSVRLTGRGAATPSDAERPRGWKGVWRWPLYGFASGYVAIIRGTPFLVQGFIVYYAIIFAFPRLSFFGISGPFWAGLIALTINTTGYQAEALRGGFQSVDASQIEGGKAVGMTWPQIFGRIVFPQGIRLVTLPLTNEWISNFKTSAILGFISVPELYTWGHTDIAESLNRPVEGFVMIAIFYLVINVTLSRVVSYVEARRRIPGLGTATLEAAIRASTVSHTR
jgi:His/Glu/Gln/Arg/opine family amino acid ABC transporter permease subunit